MATFVIPHRVNGKTRLGDSRLAHAVLSGGGGGARFLCGVVDAVDPAAVTAIVNVGDDLEVLGLAVSPDLDGVVYALAGLADPERGRRPECSRHYTRRS